MHAGWKEEIDLGAADSYRITTSSSPRSPFYSLVIVLHGGMLRELSLGSAYDLEKQGAERKIKQAMTHIGLKESRPQ